MGYIWVNNTANTVTVFPGPAIPEWLQVFILLVILAAGIYARMKKAGDVY